MSLFLKTKTARVRFLFFILRVGIFLLPTRVLFLVSKERLDPEAVFFFPHQRKLKGSSAQISSGVFRCGSQEQVPEAGSGRFRRVPVCAGVGSGGRFRRVPVCAGVGSGGRFRNVPESSGVCWCRFRRQVPEGSGEFRCVAGVGSGGKFRKATAVGDTTKAYFFSKLFFQMGSHSRFL